jgi:hypothetical protein
MDETFLTSPELLNVKLMDLSKMFLRGVVIFPRQSDSKSNMVTSTSDWSGHF